MRRALLALAVPLLLLAACSKSDSTTTTTAAGGATTTTAAGSATTTTSGGSSATTSGGSSSSSDLASALSGSLSTTPGVTDEMVVCVATDLETKLSPDQVELLVTSNGDITALPTDTQDVVITAVTTCIPVEVFAKAIGDSLAASAGLTAAQGECVATEILKVITPEELIRLGLSGATEPPPAFQDAILAAVQTCGVDITGGTGTGS